MVRARVSKALAAAAALMWSAAATAQPMWSVTNAGLFLEGNAHADCYSNDGTAQDPLGIGDTQAQSAGAFIAGYNGFSYGNRIQAYASDRNSFPVPNHYISSTAVGQVTVAGDGSMEVVIEWFIHAGSQCFAPDNYDGNADSRLNNNPGVVNTFIELDTTGVPAGTPLIIYYSWDAFSRAFSRDEGICFPAVIADYAIVSDTSLAINGVEQLSANYSFSVTPPFTDIAFGQKDQSGQLNIVAGNTVLIEIRGRLDVGIFDCGAGFMNAEDDANATFRGRIRLSTGTPPIPQAPPGGLANLGAASPDFSLDIGSDAELSELPGPLPEAPEVFDPGDAYEWFGPPLPPGGANGIIDDANLLAGLDAAPTPAPFPPTPAPICVGPIPFPTQIQYFDLDGHDEIDLDLSQIIPLNQPLNAPIVQIAGAQCIFGAEHLFVSFEDDQSNPYYLCDIPNNTMSPTGLIHGDAGKQDEVFGVSIFPVPPAPVYNAYPVGAETVIHVSMDPDPDPTIDEWDDDIDSIDIPEDRAVCSIVYFSCDHEAPGSDPNHPPGTFLLPGFIYQAIPGGSPIQVIDPFIHLGLSLDVDIADFEFVWLEDTITGTNLPSLAILFSVHPDDPSTNGVDESGGQNPGMIYFSFFTGRSFPLLAAPFSDPIDALASWKTDLAPAPFVCCPGNANGDNIVDFDDIVAILGNWLESVVQSTPNHDGDADCDGDVDFDDIVAALANWLNPCP